MQTRRLVLAGIGLTGLAACATPGSEGGGGTGASGSTLVRPRFVTPPLAPLKATPNRLSRITVCTRPFRGAGPRIEAEAFGDKRLVHNYGHGGSGWSLSWGSAEQAAALALEGGAREVAVIGCGAIGLTTALTLLRSGASVTIYAAERAPFTRSARATGLWSPSSRVAQDDQVDAGFAERWEAMARRSWAVHHSHLGLDGDPVKFVDIYALNDAAGGPAPRPGPAPSPGSVPFSHLGSRLRGLAPSSRPLDKSEHPFPVARTRMAPEMTFNVAEYADQIAADVLREGGRIEQRVFHAPSELAALTEPVIVNCTGYGARALFGDETIVPVRGQIAWLTPQPEVTYGLYYRGVSMLPRADGIVIQAIGGGDMVGYGVENETPDRAEAEACLEAISPLWAGARPA
ncbi:FAD-dependent oxidoreductase [Brevundimonas sp.]|uniref:FAD-dependent oxidoreductase n=1 Tax=Brevundimonas sp. TaxID=1871086 RepID=UPI0035AE10DE